VVKRLGWATIALVVWPVYYVMLFARWVLNVRFWSMRAFFDEDDRIWDALRRPPFVERLRGYRV
jgi:hypothetical protein